MIVMKNVYKQYPNGVVAANGINIEINRGEFVYVVGPSGAGKSTFIKMMYREEASTSGQIIINGINLATMRNKRVPYSHPISLQANYFLNYNRQLFFHRTSASNFVRLIVPSNIATICSLSATVV